MSAADLAAQLRVLADQVAALDPVVVPAEPSGPALVPLPATAIFAGPEHTMSPVFAHEGDGVFGADTRWIAVRLPAASVPISVDTFGADPAPGVTKALYITDASMLPPPVDQPAPPAPVPVAPGPPTPAPADLMTPESLGKLTALHYGIRPNEVPESELASLPQSFADGDAGDEGTDWGATGEDDEIGIVGKSSARAAITLDPRAFANMRADAKVMQWVGIHQSTPDNPGQPPKFWLFPNKSSNSSSTGDMTFLPDATANPAIKIDTAHERHPLWMYAKFMKATGNDAEFQWALTQMKYWVAYNYFSDPDNYRGYSLGIIWSPGAQARSSAWKLAPLFQLFDVLDPSDEWYAPVKVVVQNNVDFYLGVFVDATFDLKAALPEAVAGGPGRNFAPYRDFPLGFFKNTLGLVAGPDPSYSGDPTPGGEMVIGAFQQAFLAQVWLWGYKLLGQRLDAGYADKFKRLALFVAKWPVMLFGPANTPGTWDWRRAGEYSMKIGVYDANTIPVFDADGGTLLQRNYGSLPPLPDDRSFRYHDTNDSPPGIAGGYVDNIGPALSLAVDIGAPGAAEGHARRKSSTQYTSIGAWQFDILPEGEFFLPGTAPVDEPVVTPPVAGPVPAPPVDNPEAVDPTTWLTADQGRIPFKQTIRDVVPDDRKDFAPGYVEDWPCSVYFRSTNEIDTINGGHQVYNVSGVIRSSLTTLARRMVNKPQTLTLENSFVNDGLPNAEGVLKTMHGYNGYFARNADWGLGPDLLVFGTYYRDGVTLPNPIGYYDVSQELGGGGAFYTGDRDTHLQLLGDYPIGCTSEVLKSFFLGDNGVNPGEGRGDGIKFARIPGDGSDPDGSWPNPIEQFANMCLTEVTDGKLSVAVKGAGFSLNITDLDETKPTGKTMKTVGVVVTDPLLQSGFEANRAGFTWLRGKGIVGCVKTDPNNPASEMIGVQIDLGDDPWNGGVSAKVVYRNLPQPPNGVYGSHVAVHDLGITTYETSVDEQPMYLDWPKLAGKAN